MSQSEQLNCICLLLQGSGPNLLIFIFLSVSLHSEPLLLSDDSSLVTIHAPDLKAALHISATSIIIIFFCLRNKLKDVIQQNEPFPPINTGATLPPAGGKGVNMCSITLPPRLTPAVAPLLFISKTDAEVYHSLCITFFLFNPEGLMTDLSVRTPPHAPLAAVAFFLKL